VQPESYMALKDSPCISSGSDGLVQFSSECPVGQNEAFKKKGGEVLQVHAHNIRSNRLGLAGAEERAGLCGRT
jgi:hypothetical protein